VDEAQDRAGGAAVLVVAVVAHPDPASLNHAIFAACVKTLSANGHEVLAHDLYAEDFGPLLPYSEFERDASLPAEIGRHCEEIAQADGIIIVHPNWWGMPPAILKGWVDRVFRAGVAYEFVEGDQGEGIPRGLLKADRAIVFNTANTDPGREMESFGDPLDTICIFGLCGVSTVHRRTFSVVVTSSDEERQAWLADVGATVDRFFPKKPAG
jgi:NAD(P)H dehydrogenase (quinone)